MPFAAKFGYTEEDFDTDSELKGRLMDDYARSYGYNPTTNWILIVHEDDTSEFNTFEDPSTMWCCDRNKPLLPEYEESNEQG